MNHSITLQSLRNTMKVAKHTQKPENIKASISNKERDISITLTYHPIKDAKQDIYPSWIVEMKEENKFLTVNYPGKDIEKVKELYNQFVSQGSKSFLEKYIPY